MLEVPISNKSLVFGNLNLIDLQNVRQFLLLFTLLQELEHSCAIIQRGGLHFYNKHKTSRVTLQICSNSLYSACAGHYRPLRKHQPPVSCGLQSSSDPCYPCSSLHATASQRSQTYIASQDLLPFTLLSVYEWWMRNYFVGIYLGTPLEWSWRSLNYTAQLYIANYGFCSDSNFSSTL